MPLTVKVLSYKGQPLSEQLSASFGPEEGSLGRTSENHFILPDPERFVSHTHAIIHYENGCYYLKDVSSNGTFIFNKNLRVHRESIQLEDGDILRIGDYDLIVRIVEAATNHGGDTSFFRLDQGLGSQTDPPLERNKPSSWLENDSLAVIGSPAVRPEIPADFDPKILLALHDAGESCLDSAFTGAKAARPRLRCG